MCDICILTCELFVQVQVTTLFQFGDYVIDLQNIPHPIEETIPV
ncbi:MULTISPECIES: hypothetical protein [Bacillus]|nr:MULTISPECIES: hypothetical protein [Bacillus]